MATIALLGATGALGRALGRLLSSGGRPYRAVSRSYMGLKVRVAPDPMAETVLWEPQQQGSIADALAGIETAIYLVGMPLWEFATHLSLTRHILDAARAAGVRRLLLVSSAWAYGSPQSARVDESHPLAATTTKGKVRAEQESLVLRAHSEGLLETSVLRSADFYGPYVEASYLWSAFHAARNRGHAQLMRPADMPHEFVYVHDAARTILRLLEVQEVWGSAWNLGGVGVTSIRAMAERIFAEADAPVNYEIPPAWKMRIIAMMNPYVRALGEMQYLLETPILLNDAALAGTLGGLGKTPYAQGIRETLATGRAGKR